MITEGFETKRDPDLQDVSLQQTQCLDGRAWGHYIKSQDWQDLLSFDHYGHVKDGEWRYYLKSLDFKELPASDKYALTSEQW